MRLNKLRTQPRTQLEISARAKFEEIWALAGEVYEGQGIEKILKPSFCFFDHKAAKSGVCNYTYKYIAINAPLLAREGERLINRTIAHEIAHHIAAFLFGQRGHGQTWKNVWAKLGGTEISRCHSFDTSGLTKKKTVQYKLVDSRTLKVVKYYFRKPKMALGIQHDRWLASDASSRGHLCLIKAS